MAEVLSAEEVQAIVQDALAERDQAHSEEIAKLNSQIDAMRLAATGGVITLVPEHSGGPGNELAQTWSQYEQTLARQAAEAARAT